MDTHNQYESYNPERKIISEQKKTINPPINEIVDIVNKYGHMLEKNDENN